jgi:hypothetical protein
MTNSSKESSILSQLKTFESPKLKSLDNLEKSKFSHNAFNNINDYNKNEATEEWIHTTDISIRSNNFLRAFILFILGSLLSFVLNILQMEYKSNLFPSNVLSYFQTIWWAIPLCGLAAGRKFFSAF